MANLLTTASVMMCPHGGTVTAIPTDLTLTFGGSPVILATDTFLVAGCPFIPLLPLPCLTVQWVSPALRSTANSNATLTTESVGLCLSASGPAGPVMIIATQPQAGGL